MGVEVVTHPSQAEGISVAIHTDSWMSRVIDLLVNVEHLLHLTHKGGILLGGIHHMLRRQGFRTFFRT